MRYEITNESIYTIQIDYWVKNGDNLQIEKYQNLFLNKLYQHDWTG